MTVDWAMLREAATEAARHAYAPYSGLRVGAAALTTSGQVVTGCNVENASYGLTLCAECGLVSALHAAGAGRLAAVAVVAGDGAPLVPCGRCRQLLFEAGGPNLPVDTPQGVMTVADLLPGAFTAADLDSRREPLCQTSFRSSRPSETGEGSPTRRSAGSSTPTPASW